MFKLKFYKTRDVKSPTRGTPQSAGLDFYIPNDAFNNGGYKLYPGDRVNIPSGIHVNFTDQSIGDGIGMASIFFNKSGVALRKGLLVGAEVIDEDYQGEIHINLFNASTEPVVLGPGDKIIQLLLMPVMYAEPVEVMSAKELYPEKTIRGTGGFGSTGNK